MKKGIIVKLGPHYGFIEKEEGGQLHFREKCLKGIKLHELCENDKVEYEDGEITEKGPTAVWVKRIGSEKTAAGAAASQLPKAKYFFRNPYNFVRFLDAGEGSSDKTNQLGRYAPQSHGAFMGLSGTISCTFETITPLFIAGKKEERPDKHKLLSFFEYNGTPTIPASSLRGMVRSVFEAITNSCMIHMQRDEEDRLEHRLSSDPGLRPARITKITPGKGGMLERLDCSDNAPEKPADKPLLCCGLIKAYTPKVVFKDSGEQRPFREYLLPDWAAAANKQRIAAIVSTKPTPHTRIKDGKTIITYYYYKVLKIAQSKEHASLTPAPDERLVFGYLKRTGPNIENKHDERLFFNWDDLSEKPLPAQKIGFEEETVSEYNRSLGHYWERHEDTIKQHKAAIEAFDQEGTQPDLKELPFPSDFVKPISRLEEGDLVYYKIDDNGITHLFPVAMPRQAYENPREALLPDHLQPCETAKQLCPACRLFGWVAGRKPAGNKEEAAWAGRVQFSDGKFQLPVRWKAGAHFPLAILGSPKPTTTPFYLVQKSKPTFQVDYDSDEAQLRGRKFYWHHGMAMFSSNSEKNPAEWLRIGGIQDKSNVTLEKVIDQKQKLDFDIRFENLDPVELGALLWSLKLEKGWHHRLGLAKPLGFGSLSLIQINVSTIDREARYGMLGNTGIVKHKKWQEEYIEIFQKYMKERYGADFDKLNNYIDLQAILSNDSDLPIHYPRPAIQPKAEGAQFEWFVGNKKKQHRPLQPATKDEGFQICNKKGEVQDH